MKPLSIKFLVLSIFISYLYLAVFSLLFLYKHDHHNPIIDCPFMVGKMAICQMNGFDHITFWKYISIALPVKFVYFIFVITTFIIYRFWLKHTFDPPDNLYILKFLHFIDLKKTTFSVFILKNSINPRAP